MVEVADYGMLSTETEMKNSLRMLVQHQAAPITHMERVFAEELLYFVDKLDEYKAEMDAKFDKNVEILNTKIREYDAKIAALETKRKKK
jgi:uncharacterized membrane-anchored protein YhcB (DUF1043 family)